MLKDEIIIPVIPAGGSGTRLWPLSRKKLPKQFNSLGGKLTLIQKTLLRLNKMKIGKPIIICNNDHKYIVQDQILQIKIECEILLEPVAKNTAPAIALVALLKKPETNLLILPSDHIIKDEKKFVDQVENSLSHLKNKKIVVFGVKPNSPNINYGYIETGKKLEKAYQVKSFKEKPNIKLAKKYFKSDKYFWNSGIFLFTAETYIKELKKFSPEILNVCKNTIKTIEKSINFTIFDEYVFSKSPNTSIDYAVMENTKESVVIPLETDWSDIGTWGSLLEASPKDNNGNVLKGNVITSDTNNSIIYSLNKKLLAVNEVDNLTIIDTKDALLVSSNKRSTNLKLLVEKVKIDNSQRVDTTLDENRPWGSFESIIKEQGFQVKKIIVKSGGQLSLQKHKHRSEHWVVVSGVAEVIKGKDTFTLYHNQSVYIPTGVIHSLKNNSKEPLVIIEVQTGSYLEEDDIERFNDIYGRK